MPRDFRNCLNPSNPCHMYITSLLTWSLCDNINGMVTITGEFCLVLSPFQKEVPLKKKTACSLVKHFYQKCIVIGLFIDLFSILFIFFSFCQKLFNYENVCVLKMCQKAIKCLTLLQIAKNGSTLFTKGVKVINFSVEDDTNKKIAFVDFLSHFLLYILLLKMSNKIAQYAKIKLLSG